MSTYIKNGVEISMPEKDKSAILNMERCADFVAQMIQKYGKEVMAEIEIKEKCENQNT